MDSPAFSSSPAGTRQAAGQCREDRPQGGGVAGSIRPPSPAEVGERTQSSALMWRQIAPPTARPRISGSGFHGGREASLEESYLGGKWGQQGNPSSLWTQVTLTVHHSKSQVFCFGFGSAFLA